MADSSSKLLTYYVVVLLPTSSLKPASFSLSSVLIRSFTDAHPDPFYAAGHPVSGACHAHSGDKKPDTGKKGKNGKKKPTEDRKDMAGHWGVGQR